MKTFSLGLVSSLFLFLSSFAQTAKSINSGEIIEKGIKLHDAGNYKEALQLYKQVPRNDSNYVLALYETVLSQMLDSNYHDALQTCERGLSQLSDEYELEFLQAKGSILDDQGFYEKAMQAYDSALSKYPNAETVLLNKATSLLRQERLDEAESILQKILIRNPYYASAHFKLAQCALLKGQTVPATMSLFAYLFNNPDGNYYSNTIKLLSSISTGTDDIRQYIDNRKTGSAGSYALIEKIILSKIALDKNYKPLAAFDDPIFRQLQVLMEKLQYNADDNDFWMQFYVPSFKKLFGSKLFEPAVFHAFSNANIEKIQQYVKKNKKEIKEAIEVFIEDMSKIRSTEELNFEKRQTAPVLYHFDDGILFGKGNYDKDKMTGKWEFYHTNGNLKSFGTYNANGKKQGKWTYYYKDGKLSGYDSWNDGEQTGEDLTYNNQGVLVTKADYSAGKLNGEKHNYYGVGHLFSIQTYKNGVQEGKYLQYYSSGHKKTEANFSADELNGTYISYYESGQVQLISIYEKGKLNGVYKSYYENGKPDFEGTYSNGELDGETKSHHWNGSLMNTSIYRKGLLEGDYIEYNDEGVVTQKVPYKNGKAEGLGQYFDDDGKLFSTFLFENDKLTLARYFDKAGKEISASARKNKVIELTNYDAEGFKSAVVTYNDKGQKENENLYYYTSGSIKEKSIYENGEVTGLVTGFYPNGAKDYEIAYSQGKKNGLYSSFFLNGKIKSEGWYLDDALNGDWVDYNEKGVVEATSTYSNGDLTGVRAFYFANGKLDYEEVYRSGWLQSIYQYDTTGKIISTSTITNGTGKYKGLYANGKTQYEGNYVQGELHGTFTNYFFDGSVRVSKSYDHGLLTGDYVEYHYGGKISAQGKFSFGKKTGIWKYYLKDGSLFREETYEYDNLNGRQLFYFPNGKIEREIIFKDRKKHGM